MSDVQFRIAKLASVSDHLCRSGDDAATAAAVVLVESLMF